MCDDEALAMTSPDAACGDESPDGQVECVDGPTDADVDTTTNVIPQNDSVTLHSPSSMIVGTPFSDANSTRFEYPFPDKQEAASASPPHTSPTSPSAHSASQPQLALASPPTLQHYPASFPPPPDLPNYSPTHPKMRPVDPPVPPALVKRRQRWSLGLGSLSRKISLRTGSAPTGPVSPSPAAPDPDHRRVASDEHPTTGTPPPDGAAAYT